MSNQPQHFYEFGPFRLDTEKRRVMRDGEIVSLTPKAFELLAVLVQRGGQLVEKEDLMQQVWPETFVEEGNLSVHIFALRKALGEDDNGQGYIETVPRQGYRFTSSVREVEPNGAALIVEKHTRSLVTIEEHEESDEEREIPAALAESQAVVRSALKRRRYTQVAVAAAVLLTVAVGSFIYFQRNPKQPATLQLRTIAVLPFKPLSTEADDEYFRTGMADALIIKLGSLRQIVVRPTSAVLRYTDSKEDSQAIGRALGVDAVLEGYIQRDGERIRATARLISVRDGAQLWAGRFDDSFTNVFAVQDSISAQVAHSLSTTFIDDEKRALTKRYTENTEAYLEYLKGRYFWNKRTDENLSRSLENFQKAIELDPNFALAYAGLADSYALLVWNSGSLNPELINKTRIAARKALELDSTLAEAHTSLAFTRCWYEWDWQGAETEYKTAIELNPNYATAHHWYGEFLVLMGRFDEGFRELKLAQEIDPLSLIISADIGKMHFFARRPEQAIEQLQKTVEMDSTFPVSHLFLAMAYRQKGMYDEAVRELEEEGKLSEGRTLFSAVLGYCYAVSGRKAEARTLLEQLKTHSATEFEIALVHTGLGDKDQAFEWLEKAYDKRDPFLLYLKVDPNLDSLRTDPRFQTLLRRLNLGLINP